MMRSGYCYVRLFKDVLGRRVSVRETKRIFGRYPRIRDVVLQLAKCAEGECYVHDVFPTSAGVYHVSTCTLIKLSNLVCRFMFSDDVIGGYDVAGDEALAQSHFARNLASVAGLGDKTTRQVLSSAASVLVSRELANENSGLMKFVQNSCANHFTTKTIKLPFNVSPLEHSQLQDQYPEYALINTSKVRHAHSVAANCRVLNMELLLGFIGYKHNASPVYGEDVYAVDIGGDYTTHITSNRLNIHSCAPVLTLRDSARETTRRLKLAALVRSGKITESTYNRVTCAAGPCKQRCDNRAESCGVTATYVIINHAEYDITRKQLADAFDLHKPRVAYSAIHFDPRIFTKSQFVIDSLKARVTVAGGVIHFDFVGDSSSSYSHDFKNYTAIVTANYLLTEGGRCYVVERVGQRGPTLFLKYTLCDVRPESLSESTRFCFWMDECDDTLVVNTWKYQSGYYRDSKFVLTGEGDDHGRFTRTTIEVSKKLYELIMANCMRASEKGFNLSEMLSAALAFNSRLTINGQDVRTDRDRLDVQTLALLVVACYCMAYVCRYAAGKTVEMFVQQEKAKRGHNKLSFLDICSYVFDSIFSAEGMKRKWNRFVDLLGDRRDSKDMTYVVANSVRAVTYEEHVSVLAGFDHYAGEAVLETDAGPVDLLNVHDVLELKYEDGKLVPVPRAGEKILPQKTAQITQSRPAASVVSNVSIVSGDRKITKKFRKYTDSIVRSISGIPPATPLPDASRKALNDFRSQTDECEKLVVVGMPGDGRCAYYSMLHFIGIPPSSDIVELMRPALYDMCPQDLKDVNANLLSSDYSATLAWGSTDNFSLFSEIVDSTLCIHVRDVTGGQSEVRTDAYSRAPKGANGKMHVLWKTNHFDALDNDTIARDNARRASAFVTRLQERLFDGAVGERKKKLVYDQSCFMPKHGFVNRSGLKLLSILSAYKDLRTSGPVLDLCGAPGGFSSVLEAVNADYVTVSGPAIKYDPVVPAGKRRLLDIFEDTFVKQINNTYALVLADGADENSWKDDSILKREMEIITEVLRPSGNCVVKVNNFFTQMDVARDFMRRFRYVSVVKPEFSPIGNTEVYLICRGFGEEHVEVAGEAEVHVRLMVGLLTYSSAVRTGNECTAEDRSAQLLDLLVCDVIKPWNDVLVVETEPVVDKLVGGAVQASVVVPVTEHPLQLRLPSVCDSTPSTTPPSRRKIIAQIDDEEDSSDDEDSSMCVSVSSDTATTVPLLPTTACAKLGLDNLAYSSPGKEMGTMDECACASGDTIVEDSIEPQSPVQDKACEDLECVREHRIEKFLDDCAVRKSDTSEGQLTLKEKIGVLFGVMPGSVKRVKVSSKTEYYIKSRKTCVKEGGLEKATPAIDTVLSHEITRSAKVVSHVSFRDVGTDMNGAYIEKETVGGATRRVGKRQKWLKARKLKTKTATTGTMVDFDDLSPRTSEVVVATRKSLQGEESEKELEERTCERVEVSEEVAQAQSLHREQEREEVSEEVERARSLHPEAKPEESASNVPDCQLATIINGLEKVNIPDNEPQRATALYFAVDSIKQDLLISYAWPEKPAKYKFSKCIKRLTKVSAISSNKLDQYPVVLRLRGGVIVRYLVCAGIRVLLVVVPTVHHIENAVLALSERIAEITMGVRCRVSYDVFKCKEYSIDSFSLTRFSSENPHLIMVLYRHNQFTGGRSFASRYLYPGRDIHGLFPQLNDEDLGLIRCPSLLDDSIMENRFKNSMIEYLHTCNFSDKMLALNLRKIYDSAIGNDGLPIQSVLVQLVAKGYFFYDNERKTMITGVQGPHQWAFTVSGGDNVFVKYLDEKTGYDTTAKYCLFSRATKVMLNQEIYQRLSPVVIANVTMPNITWINGPPGCGKTEFALREHKRPTDVSAGDIILTVTKEGCDSLRKRVADVYGEDNVNRNYRTVASVLHNGCGTTYERVIIDEALMVHAGQLAFVSVLTGAKEMILIGDVHQIPYIDRDHVTTVKYHNPASYCSITRTLRRTHRCPVDVTFVLSDKYDGFYSVSNVVVSMRRERFSGRGVEKEQDVVYLVLFQSDKTELIRQGYESGSSRVLTVHEAQGQTFENVRYVRTSHKPLKLYDSEGHAIVAISRHTRTFVYYTDVDDRVTKMMDRVAGRSVAELTRWNDERKLQNGEKLVGGYYAPATTIYRPDKNTYAGPEATQAMVALQGHAHNPNIPQRISEGYAGYSLPFLTLRCPKDTDMAYLQDWYDSVMPTSCENDVRRDQLLCESSDLQIAICDRIEVDPIKMGYTQKRYKPLEPKLRTLMPSNIVQSQLQTLLSLSKRNANAPVLRNEEISPIVAADYMFTNFIKSCIIQDFDMNTAFDTIEFNAHLLQQWLDKQPTGVSKQIASDKWLHERSFDRYNFMVKDKLKPPLEPNAAYKIPGGQTIAYHDKEVNAAACPVFAVARDRLISILKPNIMLMTGVSNEEFEQTINDRFDVADLFHNTNKVENDFSKFDKSQHETLLRFEIRVYRMLGVPEALLTCWYESHRRSVLKDKTHGVSMRTEFQRKSGDAVTFLGNTLCLLGSTAACYDMTAMRLGLFAGDDSLLFMESYYPAWDATSAFADWFNLESKLLDSYHYPYFCSKFIIMAEGRLWFIPDVLKLVTKLGRSDLVNWEHVEEYRISLCDTLRSYGNVLLHEYIDMAVVERYKTKLDTCKVLRIVTTFINDRDLFATMFVCDDEKSLMNKDSTRPSLD